MPEAERVALIVVDVLTDYDHPDGDRLAESAREAMPHVVELLDAAHERDVLTVYVNDNFQDWTLDRHRMLERFGAGPYRELVEAIAPRDDVALVLKGRHSIFWETPLAFLLREAGVERVVLCGQVTEQCILYSALDAHVRQFHVTIARDACACIHPDLAEAALKLMELNMHARVTTAAEALEQEVAA